MKLTSFSVAAVALASLGLIAMTSEPLLLAPSATAVGSAAPKFDAKLMTGKDVSFPKTYAGKVVLVDFWATWCPPCRAEVPNLVAAWDKHGGEHFSILSISLDKPRDRSAEVVEEFVKKNKMAWDHIYEGTVEIADAYDVSGIPAPFLIDGDTGKILADESKLRGERLVETVKRAVEKKAKEKAEK